MTRPEMTEPEIRFTSSTTAPDAELPPRFARYISQLRSATGRVRLSTYPDLPAEPWHDAQRFPIVHELERRAPRIIAEAAAIDTCAYSDEPERIGRDGRWTVFFLFERGRKNVRNCQLCPTAAQIIETSRSVTTVAGLAYFSRLDPHSRVAPHTGPTNLRLRCHLGVDVPDGAGIRVGGVERTWEPGRCIVFDESFEHEVWNTSDLPRTVLIVDLWHPALSDDEVLLLDGLQRYAAGQRRELSAYWDARLSQSPAPPEPASAPAPAGAGGAT